LNDLAERTSSTSIGINARVPVVTSAWLPFPQTCLSGNVTFPDVTAVKKSSRFLVGMRLNFF